MKKDFLSIKDLSVKEIEGLFELTKKIKSKPASYNQTLKGKTLALIFQKPSNRTRVSFEVSMYELGGYPIYLGPSELGMGKREPAKDIARTLSRYIDGIVARTFDHKDVLELAEYASVPVINALTDLSHPCQAMADIFTIIEHRKRIKKLLLCYVGDGNNVLHSLLYICSKLGIDINAATPRGYEPNSSILKESLEFAKISGSNINVITEPQVAAKGADILYTDVWVSMGQEEDADKKLYDFKGYQINKGLLRLAKKDAIVMHCLPAHRGEEITDEVMESKQSVIFDQAENRLHVQKAILVTLLQ